MAVQFVTRFPDYKPSGRTVNGRRITVGVDIDGCVDPGMYKHEPGFAVASLYHFKLQMITPVAMRAWMYVNCYSRDRGITRFVALYKWLDILRETPSVQVINLHLPRLPYLRRWAEVTKSLSPEALQRFIEADDFSSILGQGDSKEEAKAELKDIVVWSNRVNELAKEASANIMAFPSSVKVLRKLYEMGVDLCAVSGTPEAHVIEHLRQYGILDCFQAVFAQQAGKKHLSLTTMMAGYHHEFGDGPLLSQSEPQYDVCAMFGDAPKDYEEAQKANKILSGKESDPVRMFMIQVGHENESWEHFYNNVLDSFVNASWSKQDESRLVQEGLANLDRVWDPKVAPIDTFPKRWRNSKESE